MQPIYKPILFLLTLLPAIAVAASLANNFLFINPTLSAVFFYMATAAVFIGSFAVLLILQRNDNKEVNVSLPVILVFLWGIYVSAHGLLFAGFNLYHQYIIVSCVFSLSVFLFFKKVPAAVSVFIGLIIALAVIESIVCLLQFVGLAESLSRYFKVTGTNENPNVTAMFLALSVPVLLAKIINTKQLTWFKGSLLLVISLAILVLNCRSAYLGALVGAFLMLNYRFGFLNGFFIKKAKMGTSLLILVLIAGLLSPLFQYLYHHKKDSADGRKLIWELSFKMFKAQPIKGYGYGMFEREYNLYQANYFKKDTFTSDQQNKAGHVNMAYNEFLQNAVEGGFVGVLLFFLLLYLLLSNFNIMKGKPGSVAEEKTDFNVVYVAAYSGIAGFVVMSLVNFTIQAVPVMCLFVIFCAILANHPSYKKYKILPEGDDRTFFRSKVIPAFLFLAGVILCIKQYALITANLQNNKAKHLAEKKEYPAAIKLLEPLTLRLVKYESYWVNYGDILLQNEKYQEAGLKFEKAKTLSSSPALYRKAAYCYQQTGQYENAAENFIMASALEPKRLAPRYTLMKFYMERGDMIQALHYAKILVEMKPKVMNAQANFYKKEASLLLKSQLGSKSLILKPTIQAIPKQLSTNKI